MESSMVKMEPEALVKIEPQDVKTEPESDNGIPKKKKKSPGRPKKLKQEKITDHVTVKKRKHDRFKGMSEEEVAAKLLPDHLAPDLDIVIIGINPGLFAAFTGHHYAGPGNHFWKCMYLSGLIPEPMNALQDFKLLEFGIGFTNIVARTTRGSADLSKKEIKEGAQLLTEKLLKYKPKIAVFNGKGIYEVFVGHKNFYFGKQPDLLPGTETAVYVMPSSSARCSQLPRAVDKVPFYEALKKFRDHLTGKLPDLAESEICFPDLELKTAKKEPKKEGYEEIKMTADMKAEINDVAGSLLSQFSQGNYQVIPHSSASGYSNSQTINGLAMSQVKQEPQDSMLDNQSVCQIKQEPKESQPGSLPVTQIKQEPQDSGYVNQCVSVSQSQAAQTVSLYQTSTELKSPQSIQQCQESQSRKDSGIPDLSSVQQSRESQDSSLSNMPPLQQFVKVKQEPEEYKESSCTAGQSNASSYLPQYLNIDQSDPVPQNGNSFSSFLQGMYGMVNKVANQQQSTGNYGMVNLANQTHVSASQPLQFNQALCDIVRDVSNDMEPFDGVHSMSSSGLMATPPLGGGMAIKKEVDIEKTTKPKPRKRKSNSKLVSTVTSPSGENQVPFNSSSSYSSQSYPSTNASRSNVQGYPSMSNSSQSNPVGNYPPLTQPNNMPGVPSHNSPSMYPQQNFSHYPSITTAYQQQLATGNHYHQSNGNHYQSAPFPHSQQSFSQMMAQDPDWFRTYQYDQSAAPNMHSAFTRHPYPYSDKYPEKQSYPTNLSQQNDLRMSADATSSQAANDLAVDLRQALDKSSSNFETGLLQSSDDHEKSKLSGSFVKQEKSEA